MSFKDEIIQIQNKNKATISEDFLQHIVECMDEDLRKFAKKNPDETERRFVISNAIFSVMEKREVRPGDLGYIRVPDSYFAAVESHYTNEGFEVKITYDRIGQCGAFSIKWG